MFINWIYLLGALVMFGVGLDILVRRRGGLYIWKHSFHYEVGYYSGKSALVVGITLSLFGFIFSIDALRSIISGEINQTLFYVFCGGSIILMGIINIFARKNIREEET